MPAQAWIKVIRKEPSVKEKEMGEINVDGNKCLGFCPGDVYLWKAQLTSHSSGTPVSRRTFDKLWLVLSLCSTVREVLGTIRLLSSPV